MSDVTDQNLEENIVQRHNQGIDWDDAIKSAVALYNSAAGTGIETLRVEQKQVLKALVIDKTPCAVVLPTGYGKSIVFEILPFLHRVVHGDSTKVLIIEPLDIIIQQELEKFSTLSFKIEGPLKDGALMSKELIFSHPEQIMSNRKMLSKISHQIQYVVIDEAHLVLDWGKEFRPAYGKVGELVSVLPNATFVAMTATATDATVKLITEKLSMTNYLFIKKSPIRPNIFLRVEKRPACNTGIDASIDSVLIPLLDALIDKHASFPRTIVYVSQNYMAYMFQNSKTTLGSLFVRSGEEVIAEYHAHHAKEHKRYVEKALLNTESSLRLVLATVALGIGADLSLVEQVIHIGPPSNLEAYIQEVGRAGRRGQESQATLFYNKADLHSTPNITKTMKDYCIQTSTCRRKNLATYFNTDSASDSSQRCCNFCYSDGNVFVVQPNSKVTDTLMAYVKSDPSKELLGVLSHTCMCLIAFNHTKGTLDMAKMNVLQIPEDVSQSILDLLSSLTV